MPAITPSIAGNITTSDGARISEAHVGLADGSLLQATRALNFQQAKRLGAGRSSPDSGQDLTYAAYQFVNFIAAGRPRTVVRGHIANVGEMLDLTPPRRVINTTPTESIVQLVKTGLRP